MLATKVAKERGLFEPRREHNMLIEALRNSEHCGRIRGVSSRQSWKKVDSWQSDAASHHTRQRYKEGLIQKGRDEAMEEIAMGKIQDAFTSNDPKMVELRKKMFLQAGVLPQQPAGTSQPQRYPVDEITEETLAILQVPFGRAGRKNDVAQGLVQPPDSEARYNGQPIPPEYALVDVAWMADDFDSNELDFPTKEGATTIGGAIGSRVLWNKADIV